MELNKHFELFNIIPWQLNLMKLIISVYSSKQRLGSIWLDVHGNVLFVWWKYRSTLTLVTIPCAPLKCSSSWLWLWCEACPGRLDSEMPLSGYRMALHCSTALETVAHSLSIIPERLALKSTQHLVLMDSFLS